MKTVCVIHKISLQEAAQLMKNKKPSQWTEKIQQAVRQKKHAYQIWLNATIRILVTIMKRRK